LVLNAINGFDIAEILVGYAVRPNDVAAVLRQGVFVGALWGVWTVQQELYRVPFFFNGLSYIGLVSPRSCGKLEQAQAVKCFNTRPETSQTSANKGRRKQFRGGTSGGSGIILKAGASATLGELWLQWRKNA
jgi:hypothetical protein